MNDTTTQASKEPGAGNMILFLLLFLIPASLTYLSVWLLVFVGLDDASTGGEALNIRIIYLGICYAIMTLACYIRGLANGRTWLVAFPIVGCVFDMFLVFIPFVPSVMNIAVLATGIPNRKS